MAELDQPSLSFPGGCPDCGSREVALPSALPELQDDFDWAIRDYDGFRLFMLEELAARFPERTRWMPGDIEVVIVEALAAVLDQLSDMLDRVTAEGYLESARRPESVVKLLSLIGYDSMENAPPDIYAQLDPNNKQAKLDALLHYWRAQPWEMERARQLGPKRLRTQQRMVTVEDYAELLEGHPLVRRASAATAWGGSWPIITVAVILQGDHGLDDSAKSLSGDLEEAVCAYHASFGVSIPAWETGPSYRTILSGFVECLRMIGQEVRLQDVRPIGILIAFTVHVAPYYFQSEVRREVEQSLSNRPGGFFEAGRLQFGQDLYVSDVVQVVMRLAGVENVCLNRFKRVGQRFPDQTVSGTIQLSGLEVAVCDNIPGRPERGFLRIEYVGGLKG